MNFKILLLVSFFFVSCKHEINKKNNDLKNDNKRLINYNLLINDTLFINKNYKGKILYRSPLDTIVKEFGNKNKNRFCRFFFSISSELSTSNKDLMKKVMDTAFALNNRIINITNVNIKSPGIYYLEGFLNDNVLLRTNKKDKNGDFIFEYIENIQPISKKIIVIPAPASQSVLNNNKMLNAITHAPQKVVNKKQNQPKK